MNGFLSLSVQAAVVVVRQLISSAAAAGVCRTRSGRTVLRAILLVLARNASCLIETSAKNEDEVKNKCCMLDRSYHSSTTHSHAELVCIKISS